MAAPKIDLSVIIPIYNEEMNLVPMNNRIIAALLPLQLHYEIIYVNDGSKDNSLPIIIGLSEENASVKYIDFSRNFGHQIAISAGLEHAVGERIVIMDGDGQDPPELIPDLLKKSLEGFEVVYAKRKKRKGESFLKKLTAKLFYRFLANITQIEIPLDTGDFRLIHRKVQKVLLNMPEQHKYLRGQIAWIGFNSTFVDYDREERMGGNTKFTYGKMMRFATDGISGFSNWPLKVATMLGFAVSGIAFMLIIYSLYQKFYGFTEVGWTSLHISVLFLGGVQNRPTYIVKNSNIQTLNES